MARALFRPIRMLGDQAGAVAVEFALLLPVMLTLFFGGYELSSLLMADMKLTATAQAAADLVATTSYLEAGDFADITSAAAQVMTPFPAATQLKLAYASVTYRTGAPSIDWHVEVNGASPLTLGTMPGGADLTELGSTTAGADDSLVVVEAQYTYTATVSYVLKSNWTLSEAAFVRPGACVATYLNTSHSCPG